MPGKEYSHIVVGFLTPQLEQQFSQVRESVGLPAEIPQIQPDGTCNLIGKPHVTLKRTFYLNEGITEEGLVERMRTVTFEPIDMSTNSWQVFDTSNLGKVAVLKMDKVPELVALHNNLVNMADNISRAKNPEFEREGFEPHASVVYHADEEKIDTIGELIDDILPIRYTLSEIHLFRKNLSLQEDPKGPDVRELVLVIKAIE